MLRATTAGLVRNTKVKSVRSLLVVVCGRKLTKGHHLDKSQQNNLKQPTTQSLQDRRANGHNLSDSRNNSNQLQPEFADLETGDYLEVHILEDPSEEELGWKLEKLHPDFLVLHGECLPGKDDVGGLVLRDGKAVTSEILIPLLTLKIPNLVYLETSGLRLGESLRCQGVPHVISWKGAPSVSLATHFRRALLASLRSSSTGPRDAFQIAYASFQIHCGQTKIASVNGHQRAANSMPMLLEGPFSKTAEDQKTESAGEEGGDGNEAVTSSDVAPVQIYDDETDVRLLICSGTSKPTLAWFGAFEVGLSALLTIEAKGVRLLHRVSAPPPPIAAATLLRGVVTMRCDICTATFARVPLLVSGAAQTCFDDQVLRQLAAESSYHSLVALGIAGVMGAPVAAFQKEDAHHLGSLKRLPDDTFNNEMAMNSLAVPSWLMPPVASRKRMRLLPSVNLSDIMPKEEKKSSIMFEEGSLNVDVQSSLAASSSKQGNVMLLAAMKPVPHSSRRKFMPVANAVMAAQHAGWSMKVELSNRLDRKRQRRPDSAKPRTSSSIQGPPIGQPPGALNAPYLSITPPIVEQHGCNRLHMRECTEEEFLQDLVDFLGSRGHGHLIPPAGFDAFPEVVLNGKRLDLYNLYRELQVVSRGGFHVGNGINWKGQIFAKMRNHTSVNKMTGVGNTLKKHYELYLLEYELAHDDVDGECCILCHSGAEGDWVNCGSCGEWAHFGCDQRSGLGAFKDYAKTDGLEYICPRCSASNGKANPRRAKLKSPEESSCPLVYPFPKTQKKT